MTFKAELTDIKLFKEAFESISRIIDEVQIQADSDGLRLKALDRSHITFILFELKAYVFDEYFCDAPEKINIDCSEFFKVLKKAKTSDILKLSVDEGNFIIIFEGDASRKFNIRLIDLEYDNPTPPNINLPCKITVPSKLLGDALGDMDLFSDKLLFQIDQDYFTIKTDGEFGDADIKYLHGENIQKIVQSSYSIDKLADMLKSSKFTDECIIELGESMPLRLTMNLPADKGYLSFLLAPRIEQED